MKKLFLIGLVISLEFQLSYSQEKYFVSFIDKQNNSFSIDKPHEFLSIKSIERRERQGIEIDYTDLPVTQSYIQQVKETGAKVMYTLKWFNGLVVETYGDNMVSQIVNLNFVKEIEKVYEPSTKSSILPDEEIFPIYTYQKDPSDFYFYGSSSPQIKMLNGHILHNKGYKGKGITIGVLDAGFYQSNILPAFDSLWTASRVIDIKDFVNPTSNIFEEHTHGTLVLSVLAANFPGQLIGSAPESSYILIRSEDANTEQIIEEYNWAAGAEFADSSGVDIINSSLGYYNFDAIWQNHTYSSMDGITTPAAKAANFAEEKGILVVVSAGNEGSDAWKYIITPSDAIGALAVGAVNSEGERAYFSSIGPSFDSRVKPDIMAMGESTVVQSPNGNIGSANGTSLSAPVISGLAACLWQALPNVGVRELISRIKYSSSFFDNPNYFMGYGIPNFALALDSLPNINSDNDLGIFPNPTSGNSKVIISKPFSIESKLVLISSSGETIFSKTIEPNSSTVSFEIPKKYPSGLYIVKIISGEKSLVGKIVKINNSNEK